MPETETELVGLSEAEREALAAGWPDFWKVHAAATTILADRHAALLAELERNKAGWAQAFEAGISNQARAEAAEAELAASREALARVKATRRVWLNVHGDPANDSERLGLYGVAYRECAGDIDTALATLTERTDA